MTIKVNKMKNLTILYPLENLIGETVDELNTQLDELMNNMGDSKMFLINLKNISQIDSYALSILATFGNEIKPKGGILVFSNLQPFIHSIFRMMRMDDIFEIFEEEEQAVQKLGE